MADLLQFPVQPCVQSVGRTYQIHKFAVNGIVLTSRTVTASNDSDAKKQASKLAGGQRIELWFDNRFVAQFGSSDVPIAAWIRLLDAPLAIVP
ncbi:hypothetical protein [Methylobacterium dankookense]|uniref:hypothetical protein n=1 Tax=Methylobacterium dankookense TaxID=560405 RepID=UPI0011A87C77|nr:hypothetical protein [Methylobacterium dankookense]